MLMLSFQTLRQQVAMALGKGRSMADGGPKDNPVETERLNTMAGCKYPRQVLHSTVLAALHANTKFVTVLSRKAHPRARR